MSEVVQIEYEQGPEFHTPIATTVSHAEPPEFSSETFEAALDELNENFGVHKDARTSIKVELSVANLDEKDNGITLFGSTSSSSFTQNPSNAAEQAYQAIVEPNTTRVYIASSGNGGSNGLSIAEAWRVFSTGRFTKDSGIHAEAFETLSAVARILEKLELVPDQLTADVEGGRSLLGLAAALDPNTISKLYLNGIPGMSSVQAPYYLGMMQEDLRGHLERAKKTQTDIGKPEWDIKEMRKLAKDRLTRVYGTASNVGRLIHTYFPYNFAKTLIPTLSYGKNADLEGPIEEHALAMDMIALLSRHEAIATAQVNRNSKIHDSTQAIKFGQVVMDTIDPAIRSKKRALRLIIEEGELDEHTDNPSVRWRNERIALSGLTGIFAGLRFLQPEDVIGKSGQVQQT